MRIALTHDLPRASRVGLAPQASKEIGQITEEMGEPIISRFTPGEVEQLLREFGFADIAHIGPDEARNLYFADRADVQFLGIQRLTMGKITT
jgi:hypothetical protein